MSWPHITRPRAASMSNQMIVITGIQIGNLIFSSQVPGVCAAYIYALGRSQCYYLTHWDRDIIAAASQTTFSNAFTWKWISLTISLKFVPKVHINNIPALVQIMAWCRTGDKPLSEPMMAIFWRIHASLDLNELTYLGLQQEYSRRTRKYFKHLHHFSVERWYMVDRQIYFFFL